ncbi:MAG: DoxX family protein [Bacteroidetes bacterium]|nr:DoxX family protein [Bacteroidota bacterium]
MKTARTISRIFVGIIFIFSGFVKVIDPLGSTYKFVDYFNAFNMSFFIPFAIYLGILLSIAELIIGVSLLFNVKIKIGAWSVLLFMSFFTFLTFILAIYNPVSDCGCFGDALILTNWQTFFKNLIIIVPTIIIFLERNKFSTSYSCIEQWSIVGFFTIIMLYISIYSYNHLPIIDFRPYNVGANITEKMNIPDNAPQDEYETILFYEKDGEIKEFTLKNIPDSTWTWIKTKNKLLKQGYHPPIHDFSISTLDGDDITDLILESDDYYFLLIAYNIETANIDNQNRINDFADYCLDNNFKFICVTSSTNNQIEEYQKRTNAQYDFGNTDEITLKTIIRANPGLVLLKHGVIIDKWHFNDIPEIKELSDKFIATSLSKYKGQKDNYLIISLIVSSLLLICLYDRLRIRFKK